MKFISSRTYIIQPWYSKKTRLPLLRLLKLVGRFDFFAFHFIRKSYYWDAFSNPSSMLLPLGLTHLVAMLRLLKSRNSSSFRIPLATSSAPLGKVSPPVSPYTLDSLLKLVTFGPIQSSLNINNASRLYYTPRYFSTLPDRTKTP